MKLLSRSEELVLLAVWRLGENAYCVPIRKQLTEVTNKKWSFGAIYDPLDRLERGGYLESCFSEPTQKRGGRSKRIYKLTRKGKTSLNKVRKIAEVMWSNIKATEFGK